MLWSEEQEELLGMAWEKGDGCCPSCWRIWGGEMGVEDPLYRPICQRRSLVVYWEFCWEVV